MLANIWNTVYPVLIAILFFELIIVIHEGGHFVAARLMGVKVNEFSIGMGPKLVQFTRGETTYSLRFILFGGYCAMEGEDEDSDDENAFSNKKVIQRIFIVVAGAVMNLILGLVITSIIVCSQNLVGTTEIARFDKNAVSSQTLQAGDKIKVIDGMRVYSATDITTGLTRSTDGTLDMTVLRDGREENLSVTFDTEEDDGRQFIKLDFWLLGKEKTVPNVLGESLMQWISYGRMVFLSVHDLIAGHFRVSDLSGPVGAVGIVSEAVKVSIPSMLKIMALLTINVGLFNLFPIPALDGWRLFLLIFEGIFRRKLPPKWEWAINGAGLILLLGLMTVITFSDISKLIH
ncbi:MAG: site-2 protease family protein [Ruminococcaceae bacterium]|nr:site-2 protease family protein [Oscillospiraceae bacterium]